MSHHEGPRTYTVSKLPTGRWLLAVRHPWGTATQLGSYPRRKEAVTVGRVLAGHSGRLVEEKAT